MRLPRTATAAVLLLALSSGVVVTLGGALGIAPAPLALGVLSGIALGFLVTRRRLGRRPAPRAKPEHVLPGGRKVGRAYDLAKDRTTDAQRWLM
jgi:hypothetical protein